MDIADDDLKANYFSPGEYLIADSAYPADHARNTIIPSYRSNSKGTNKEESNTCVAHVRIANEQTIGVLTNRWSSLKELRVQIKEKKDLSRALRWIQGCVVHQLSDSDNDESFPSDEEDEVDEDPYAFRREIKRRAIAAGRKPNGILWYRARNTD
jgi:hypothetical protein